MRINLGEYKNSGSSTVFTGRPQGRSVRAALRLDELDKRDEVVYFIIPKDTTSFNPSFFLGLLFESYKKLNEKFNEKYIFIIETENEDTKDVILANIMDGERNAYNSINTKSNNLFSL